MNHFVLFTESELSHCSEIILPSHRSEIYRSHDEENPPARKLDLEIIPKEPGLNIMF